MKRKNWISLCVAAALLLGLAACGSRGTAPAATPEPETTPVPTATPVPERVLVVYFSPVTERDDETETEKGDAAIVAELLARKMSGDLYEIVPARDNYPHTYDELMIVARAEQSAKARPAIGSSLPALEGYDTVFIGAPVWYEDWPMIVYTFLEGVDLAGKKLVPFCVFDGDAPSGLDKKMARICPYSTVTEALAVKGEDAAGNLRLVEAGVDRWLRRLGYTI